MRISATLESFAVAWAVHRCHPGDQFAGTDQPADIVAPEGVSESGGDLTGAMQALDTWQTLTDADPPWLLRYLADRQAHELEHSDELNAAIDSYPRTFAAWDALCELDPIRLTYGVMQGLLHDGRVVLRYRAAQQAQTK